MAQYIPFDNNVEVRGETVLSVSNGVEFFFKDEMNNILEKNNIINPQAAKWYKQKDWLNAFKDIENKFGEYTLYKIGKAIPENAIFPEGVKNLKKALESINIAYNNNHRNGEIGYYKLISFDEENRIAEMECKNPYPCHFDRGIITKIAEKFKPTTSKNIEVSLDVNKKSRLDGADTSFYKIKW